MGLSWHNDSGFHKFKGCGWVIAAIADAVCEYRRWYWGVSAMIGQSIVDGLRGHNHDHPQHQSGFRLVSVVKTGDIPGQFQGNSAKFARYELDRFVD